MPEDEKFTLARDIASEGGKARAAKLSAAERSEIAKKAAAARWATDLPTATHGDDQHPLRIGDACLPCYVLDDGRRVLAQGGMLTALNMKQGTAASRGLGGRGDRLTKFIDTKAVNPHVPQHLREMITNPIRFKTPSGTVAHGYEATVLADLCDVVLESREKGKLNYQQEHIARQCEILVRSFAKIGIIALVDEATGYQADRARDALAVILEEFISKELCRWAKRFSDNYYRELARLRGIKLSSVTPKRPQYFGHLTNDIVYNRVAPGVLEELKRLTPRDDHGRRKHHFHRRLTEDIGHPRLQEHLAAVEALMKVSADYKQFKKMLDIALPVWDDQPRLNFHY